MLSSLLEPLRPLTQSGRVLVMCTAMSVLCGISMAAWMLTSMARNGGYAFMGGIAFDVFCLGPTMTALVLVPIATIAGIVTVVHSCTPRGGWWMLAGMVVVMATPWLMIGATVLTGGELTGWEMVTVFYAVPAGAIVAAVGLVKFFAGHRQQVTS